MTLIALLLLYPTPLLHPWGRDGTSPGDHPFTRVVAPVIRDRGAAPLAGDLAEGGGRADGEWSDDEGVQPVVDRSALPDRGWPDHTLSRPLMSPQVFQLSSRPRHLRC
jgi:hypothetical protein